MRRAALAAALATTIAGVTPAAAERREEPIAGEGGGGNAKAEAEQLALAAKARFDARDYAGAIAGYGAAYRRHPSAGLLFNLAQSYRLHGNCAAASLMYHDYMRAAPESPYRELAEQHLDALAPCRHGQAFGPIAYRGGGGRGGGGGGAGASLLMPAADEQPGRGKRVAGAVVGITGAAMAATGAYLLSDDAEAKDRQGDNEDDPAARARRNELIGAGLVGAGGVAVITGATLYVLGRRDDRAARTSFAITPNRGGMTAAVGWRF